MSFEAKVSASNVQKTKRHGLNEMFATKDVKNIKETSNRIQKEEGRVTN